MHGPAAGWLFTVSVHVGMACVGTQEASKLLWACTSHAADTIIGGNELAAIAREHRPVDDFDSRLGRMRMLCSCVCAAAPMRNL